MFFPQTIDCKKDQENQSTECQFNAHCQPHTSQPHGRSKPSCQCQPYAPYADEIHGRWKYGASEAYKEAIGHDGRREHRFRPRLNPENISSEQAYLLDGGHYADYLRGVDVEHDPQRGHHDHSGANGDYAETFGQAMTSGSDALPTKSSGGFGNAISRHVAQALCNDRKSICSDGNNAERSYNSGYKDLSAAYCLVFQSDRHADV